MSYFPHGWSASDPLERLFKLGWLVMLVLLTVPWLWLTSEKSEPSALPASDPALVAAQSLWRNEQILNTAWSEQASQWSKTHANSPYAKLPLGKAWSDLDASVLALEDRSSQILQVQQIQRALALIEPYTLQGHPDIQREANGLKLRVNSLLSQPNTGGDKATLVLTWGNLANLVDDLNQIQIQLTEIRRWSISSTVAYKDKLPLRFHEQMALVFPSLYVQQLENQANILFKSRLTIENAMAQTQLRQTLQAPADQSGASPLRWVVILLCVMVGVGWLLGLGRGLSHARLQQEALGLEIRQLSIRLQQAYSAPQSAPPTEEHSGPSPESSAELTWAMQVHDAIPDLLGRVKNIQMLFDSGQSLERVSRDLAIVEAKLSQWERSAQNVKTASGASRDV